MILFILSLCSALLVIFTSADNSEKSITVMPSEEPRFLKFTDTCADIRDNIVYLQPWVLNTLRREVQEFRSDCFEELFETFRNFTLRRAKYKHFNLHIPKSGGTSICNIIKSHDIRKTHPTTNNCFLPSTCPYWCCCSDTRYQIVSL